jgi:hypothetical protein
MKETWCIGNNRGFGDLVRKVALPLATFTSRNEVNVDGTPGPFICLAEMTVPPSVMWYFNFVHFNEMEILGY